MADILKAKAKELFDGGHISQDTFGLLTGSSSEAKEPAIQAPPKELQIEPALEEKELAITPATTEEIEGRTPAATATPDASNVGQVPAQPQGAVGPVLASEVNAQKAQPAQAQSNAMAEIGKGIESGYKMMQDATVEGAAAGIKAANAEASYLKQSALKLEEQEMERQKREAIRQEALKEKTDKLEAMITEFDSKKVDPGHFWGTRSTEQKVAIGIGMFLGAFGGPGGNSAVQVVEDAIKRDIDAQKANLEHGKMKVGMQQNLLGQMREQFGDERQAEAAAKLAMLQKVEMQTKAIAAQYKGPQVQAMAKEAFAKLEVAKQAAKMEFAKAVQTSPSFASNDEMVRYVFEKVPPKFQDEALKEVKEKRAYSNFSNGVIKTYKELNEVGLSGYIPGMLAGNSGVYETAKAKLAGAIVGKVPNIKSDADFRNVVEPMLPKPKDTPSEAARKLDLFKGFLKENAPASVYTSGVEPKELSLGAPVRK